MAEEKVLLEVKDLTKRFPIASGLFKTRGFLEAVSHVSFSVKAGETVALVGESGSGKSTLGKIVQGLLEPTEGDVFFEGVNARSLSRRERARRVQMVFQDPFASLNPKLSVGTILGEAVRLSGTSGADPKERIEKLLISVGLPANILQSYPHQFSGGQRQRIGIARALAMNPRIIVADEPVSALDLSVQAQILNLLLDLRERFGISYLLIGHDLSVIEQMSDRVLVLNRGKVVEEGPVEQVFQNPKEAYTRSLLEAVPQIP